jgi:arginase
VTRGLAAEGERFLVVGGDHSCAIGTWSGVADALRPSGALGLIWIDAHMDMHVPETSHSGAINGMPVAALLGHGASQLTSIARSGAAIDPRHLCLIGARSFEPEEVEFAQRHGVRVIDMPEVKRRGLKAVLAEAHAIATRGTAGYGVSLDLDAFDPAEAPAVGTPAPGGIRAADFLAPWRALTRAQACVGIEIVEYNPGRDRAGCTAQLMRDLVLAWAG